MSVSDAAGAARPAASSDVHWADAAAVDALLPLLPPVATLPVLFVRALGRAGKAADVDRRSQELGRQLGLMDDAFA
jgi:hypothetical protein